MTADVSVVIRTFNESRHLPALLACLREQRGVRLEVIVADSGSTDGTVQIAREGGARVVNVERDHFTFGYSLNLGIRAAVAPIVAIVSAHTRPVGDSWLASLVAPFADDQVAMVYGRQVGDAESKFGEFMDFVRTYGPERRTVRAPHFFANNANSAVRRSCWEEHPFEETLSGLEDIEWARTWCERGRLVLYEPAAVLVHIHSETWTQVRHRYYREAVAAVRLGLRGPREVPWDLLRECGCLAADLVAALRPAIVRSYGGARPSFLEILGFRVHKTIGTLRGLVDRKASTHAAATRYLFDHEYQAVTIEGAGRARLRTRQLERVKPGDVVVRVAFVGICGTDLELAEGTLGYYASGMASYPIVPGHEVSGHVAAVGARVQGMQPGDPVVVQCIQGCGDCEACGRDDGIACAARRELGVIGIDGGYARYVIVPARFVHPVPAALPLDCAALTEPLAVVLKGLERLALPTQAGSRVLVVGAGAIGRLSALVLAHRGHDVFLYDAAADRRAGAAAPGITPVADMAALPRCRGVIEATGSQEVLDHILAQSGPGTRILLLGLPYACVPFSFEGVVAFDRAVIGSVGSGARHFRESLTLLPNLDVAAFLQRKMPLARFEDAWRAVRQREATKIMLTPDD